MIFHAGRAFYSATNVDGVRHHRRDRTPNIFGVQTAGENQESGVTRRSPRSGPVACVTRAAPELGVICIDKHIAIWERCCMLWLESRIG